MQITLNNRGVTYPKGFKASGIHCGIRRNKSKKDLALICAESSCAAAAVYTLNKVKGAPILVTMDHLSDGRAQAVICNSGIANTCNADGMEKALAVCDIAAAALNLAPRDIIVASTGVIGQPLSTEPIAAGMRELVSSLSAQGGDDAAEAIMTTDTVPKQAGCSFLLNGKEVRIGSMAKGSGMIHPNMATMLCFVTTDAAIAPDMLREALRDAVCDTLNMVSVDGDTSTNDMVSVMAGGAAGNQPITEKNGDYFLFLSALTEVLTAVSRMIARDGEGATRLLECSVKNAPSKETARLCAKAVISSSLVKAAFFGADANWGRILCAMGYCGAEFDPARIDVSFESAAGGIKVCENGMGLEFDEDRAKEILLKDTILIEIDMKSGGSEATAWGCDLTYDYVRINGDYRT